ncbi:hypothetical protein V6N13_059049 [Hibiscus sabdariffa]|uniref:Uncharacterized protein n=1 Tax=Hibiscus sabdariffa TaxID=183260 RepID=A0ABR2GF54_9ROSI
MAKQKCLNVVSLIESRAQVQEQRAPSAQHQEQSQAQQSEQSEEVRGVGEQQSHEQQSQPSSGMIDVSQIKGSNNVLSSQGRSLQDLGLLMVRECHSQITDHSKLISFISLKFDSHMFCLKVGRRRDIGG